RDGIDFGCVARRGGLLIALEIVERSFGPARMHVRNSDVVEHVRVRKNLVRLLEVLDTFVGAPAGDRLHAQAKLRASLRAHIGPRLRTRDPEPESQRKEQVSKNSQRGPSRFASPRGSKARARTRPFLSACLARPTR